MKRLTLLLMASGLTVTMLTGCGQTEKRLSLRERREQRAKAAKAERAEALAAKRAAKPPRPVPAPQPKPVIVAGSIKYLDYKGGFRDVVLGQKESSFTNLVLKTEDNALAIKTYTRSGDEMSLGGVPLESIEYSFFQGQLFQIMIKWRAEQREPGRQAEPVQTLAPFCAGLYGAPTHRILKKDLTELRWRGQRVKLTLSESVSRGVRDALKGGWAVPPVASGVMVMERTDMSKALGATIGRAAEHRTDGL